MSMEHCSLCKRMGLSLALLLFLAWAAPRQHLWAQHTPSKNTSARQAEGENTIREIRTVGGKVEIEVTSAAGFPVRDELVILRIGNQEFTQSRPPKDGSLNALIFTVPAETFDKLSDGNEVSVHYGRNASAEVRRFGKLDKKLRGKKK